MPFDITTYETPLVRDLRVARAWLAKYGWCQHDFMNDRREVCAFGAIRITLVWFRVTSPADTQRATAVYDALARVSGETWFDLAKWNDTPGRTFDEVLNLFDRAIERELSLTIVQ